MNEAVQRIQRAVREEAEREAAHILREAKEQLVQMLSDARGEEEQAAKAQLAAERAACEQQALREISQFQRALRLDSLGARNQAIQEIFAAVREELHRLPEERYRALLRRWIAEIEAPEGGELRAGAQDARIVKELVAEVNAARPLRARLTIASTPAPFDSGFIFSTPRFQIERSLAGWLEEQKREMAPRLEQELFGNAADDGTR